MLDSGLGESASQRLIHGEETQLSARTPETTFVRWVVHSTTLQLTAPIRYGLRHTAGVVRGGRHSDPNDHNLVVSKER